MRDVDIGHLDAANLTPWNMDQSLSNLCVSLESLSNRILAGFAPNHSLLEHFGWNHAALSRHDLAAMPATLSKRIKEANADNIDAELKQIIETLPGRLSVLEGNTIPQFFNGNGVYAIPAFMSFMQWLSTILQPVIGNFNFETLDPKMMPVSLTRRLRGIQTQIEEVVANKDGIEEKIKLINDAHAAAEILPTDLETLTETRAKVDAIFKDSTGMSQKIKELFESTSTFSKRLEDRRDEADRLVAQCEEAYKITTTKGLAGAFDQRAKSLNLSMMAWIGGLLLALVAAAVIGSTRVTALTKLLEVANPSMLVVWTNLILSIFSIAAPVWFAWIATKQISQRFKLVEDYAFKSSIAKAYEGYRREAARIDPEFESRLFASTLSRLEELPLRVMEQKNYGSPWQEMLNWPEFKEAIKAVPELGNKVLSKVSKRSEDLEK